MVDSCWDRPGRVIQSDQLLFGLSFLLFNNLQHVEGQSVVRRDSKESCFSLSKGCRYLYAKYEILDILRRTLLFSETEYGIHSRNKYHAPPPSINITLPPIAPRHT